MKKFVTDLGSVSSVLGPMGVYHDNNDVMTQAIEPMSHPKYEHVQLPVSPHMSVHEEGEIQMG
jgi:hypothetical protein